MIPILYSQNNLPIYTKESIMSYLMKLCGDSNKTDIEYESKWLNNSTIVIVLEKEIKGYTNESNDESDDGIEKIENILTYIENLEKKFITDDEN